jgi:hypothetical protein
VPKKPKTGKIFIEAWQICIGAAKGRQLIYYTGRLLGMVQIKSIKKIELLIEYNFKIAYRYNY